MFKSYLDRVNHILSKGEDVALLLLRLFLVYTFYAPAMMKVENFDYIAHTWFVELGIPFPILNAFLATTTELLGVGLLALGLFSRIIALPLIVTMIVAIITVHGPNGFAMVQELPDIYSVFYNGELQFTTAYRYLNGYENALIYSLMLMVIMTKGAGKLSLDYWFFKTK